ncbi:hypothetical protein B0H10DRAFT_2430855 [Mycena sp. CBHHK59/15]|nr:hypothetical protein B0H10DRAFT_903600 [Mycena sp. CBHHK59/15]KAJ6624560.1 hypothetical protein B0H10DRAFT_2430855 [Mycena sp. CBHHK59/15]
MPEQGVVRLFEREVGWEEHRVPAAIDRSDDEAFFGCFVTHPQCCSRVEGRRQTFTIHVSSPTDDRFHSLPRLPPPPAPPKNPKKNEKLQPPHYCSSCRRGCDITDPAAVAPPHSVCSVPSDMPTAEFVNSLNIEGRISAKARGKELAIAICNRKSGTNFVLRVTFALEGHCFWIPTEWYNRITSQTPVARGVKSLAFPIPDEYHDCMLSDRIISIQAAFIRPEYTLIFVDHNSMIQFHVMRMSDDFGPDQLTPGSMMWSALWSSNHGPVYSQEPAATLRALDSWRAYVLARPEDFTSIFLSMKTHQTAFNGKGAQEATDLLLLALIHPQMPALYVCQNNKLWLRFLQTVVDYDKNRMDLVLPGSKLPHVSGDRPFHMNTDGHARYLHGIFSYRRIRVEFTAEQLHKAHELNLFQPNAIIQPDGHAQVPAAAPLVHPSVKTALRADSHRLQGFTRVPNFLIFITDEDDLRTYSPFTAQPAPNWRKAHREMVASDVKEDVNSTTLGLYSFRVLVDCGWSAQKVAAAGGLRPGPRPVISAGPSNRKRPLSRDVAKTAAPKKRRISVDNQENIDPSPGIMTRSRSRKSV